MTLVHVPQVSYERKSAEDIVSLFRSRQKARGPQHEQMRDILNLYQGDIAVPLPEMRREELPSIVNLAKQGINQMGMRAASVMPNVMCPPIATGRTTDAEANATKRRKTIMGWWDEVGMQIKLRQRGRWLFAYAHAPVMVCPDMKAGRPTWRPISPINTYPSHFSAFDDMVPSDCIIAGVHAVGWCKQQWPQAASVLQGMENDQLCEVLHYIDSNEYHIVVTPKLLLEEVRAQNFTGRSLKATTLDWQPNLTGRPWVVIPRSISLENPISTYSGMLGMYEAAAELDALSKIARRKGVFWEEWLVSTDINGSPEIVVRADPMNGIVGEVRGGSLERMSPEVQYSSDAGVDRYERNMRVEANLPSDFGGESSTNVRTGARANALITSAIDPVLQETHELFAQSLEQEDCIAIAIDKAYWSGRSKTIWLGNESLKYDPGKIWETDRHTVDYSLAGADINQMTIVPLQMVGAGVMSRRTAMSYHPLIKDVDKELDQVVLDQLEAAALSGIQQLIATPGGMPLTDVIEVMAMIKSGEADLIEAMAIIQAEAQERQAAQAETMAQGQPGVNMPGQGAEQPLAIPPAGDAMGNLKNILGNLRMQQMTTGPERGAPVG
jgi:hypothetical protein